MAGVTIKRASGKRAKIESDTMRSRLLALLEMSMAEACDPEEELALWLEPRGDGIPAGQALGTWLAYWVLTRPLELQALADGYTIPGPAIMAELAEITAEHGPPVRFAAGLALDSSGSPRVALRWTWAALEEPLTFVRSPMRLGPTGDALGTPDLWQQVDPLEVTPATVPGFLTPGHGVFSCRDSDLPEEVAVLRDRAQRHAVESRATGERAPSPEPTPAPCDGCGDPKSELVGGLCGACRLRGAHLEVRPGQNAPEELCEPDPFADVPDEALASEDEFLSAVGRMNEEREDREHARRASLFEGADDPPEGGDPA